MYNEGVILYLHKYVFSDVFPLKKGEILLCTCQSVSLWTNLCPFNIFKPLCLNVAKLGTVNAPREQKFPIYFQVTWAKVMFKLLVFEKMVSGQYLLTPLPECGQTWYSRCP